MTDVAGATADGVVHPPERMGGYSGNEVLVSDETMSADATMAASVEAAVHGRPDGWAERGVNGAVERFLAPRRVTDRLEDAAGDRLRSLIGHELRTPLTSVKGYARLLSRRDVPTEEVRVFGEMIADAVDRFDRVVEQLTAYTLLGSGRVEAHLAAVPVEEFVRRTAERWATEGIDLTVDAADSGIVPMDTSVVAVGLDEMLDNAVRFAIGRPKIVLSAHRVGGDLLLGVTDNGPGMPAEAAVACFDEFTQGQSPLTRDTGGLGLGLAIVRTVAELHGGDVLCESRPGQGTTVTLALPAGALWPD